MSVYKVFMLAVTVMASMASCKPHGGNPPITDPVDPDSTDVYAVLEQMESKYPAPLNVNIDTANAKTLVSWGFNVTDTCGHEYALGSHLFIDSLIEDIPDELDIIYSAKMLEDCVEGFHVTLYDGMESYITDVYAREGGMKVLKREGDYYELEYKFTMHNK